MTTYNKDRHFPFKQYRFNTTKHKVRMSTDPCKAKIETKISQTELKMLEGLTRVFQCTTNETIRIILSEAPTRACREVERYIPYSDPLTKERGYQKRLEKLAVKLAYQEKKEFIDKCSVYGVNEKQGVRLALIWFAKELRGDRLTKISCGALIPQKKLKREWQAENPEHSTTTIHGIKAAQDRYDDLGEEMRQAAIDRYEERGRQMGLNPQLGRVLGGLGFDDDAICDAYDVQAHIEALEYRDQLLEGLEGEELREAFIEHELSMYSPNVPYEEAVEIAEACFEDYQEEQRGRNKADLADKEVYGFMQLWKAAREGTRTHQAVIPESLLMAKAPLKETNEERLARYLEQTQDNQIHEDPCYDKG